MADVAAAVLAALLISVVLTPVVAVVAGLLGIVAQPNPDVPTHTRAIPLLGGIAIIGGALPAVVAAALVDERWIAFAGALAPIVALGIYKDCSVRALSPLLQLAIQATTAAIIVVAGLRLEAFERSDIDFAASMVVCLLVINAWNFVDVVDGLAAALAVVSACAVAMLAAAAGDTAALLVAVAISGSAAGFLFYNRPPARIFMGDVGSFTLGLCFAAFVMSLSRDAASAAYALLVLAVPLCDLLWTVIARMRRGRSPLEGGSEHLSLTLLARGWSAAAVVIGACLAAAAAGGAGFVLTSLTN